MNLVLTSLAPGAVGRRARDNGRLQGSESWRSPRPRPQEGLRARTLGLTTGTETGTGPDVGLARPRPELPELGPALGTC